MKKKTEVKPIPVPVLPNEELEKLLALIGRLIAVNRKNVRSSADIFAFEIGISRSTMNRVEGGKDLTVGNFLKILYGMGVELEDFFAALKKMKESETVGSKSKRK